MGLVEISMVESTGQSMTPFRTNRCLVLSIHDSRLDRLSTAQPSAPPDRPLHEYQSPVKPSSIRTRFQPSLTKFPPAPILWKLLLLNANVLWYSKLCPLPYPLAHATARVRLIQRIPRLRPMGTFPRNAMAVYRLNQRFPSPTHSHTSLLHGTAIVRLYQREFL